MSEHASSGLPADTIRANLVHTALFLTAYQLLRNAVVDGVRNHFLRREWDYAAYDQQVLVLSKSRFQASLRWLVEMEVLEPVHVDEIYEIRRHRNKIAYDLPRLLVDPRAEFDAKLLDRVAFHLQRLESFFAAQGDTTRGAAGEVPTIETASIRLLEQIRHALPQAE